MRERREEEIHHSLRIAKTNKLIGAVCLIAMGLVLFLWSGSAIEVICKVVAAIMAAAGIAVVVAFFFGRARVYGSSAGLFGGVTFLVMGMYLFFRPEILASLVPTIIGLIVLVTGLVDLSEGIRIARQRSGGTSAAVVIAALEIILGIIFVVHPIFIEKILMKLMAVVLIADGITDIWVMFQLGKAEKPLEAAAAAAEGAYEDGEVKPLSDQDAAREPKEQPSEGYTTIPRPGNLGVNSAGQNDASVSFSDAEDPAEDTASENADAAGCEDAEESASRDPLNGIEADAANAGVSANKENC